MIASPIAIETAPPTVLRFPPKMDNKKQGKKAHRMNPNVDVLVAMSLIGIAACSPMSGVCGARSSR